MAVTPTGLRSWALNDLGHFRLTSSFDEMIAGRIASLRHRNITLSASLSRSFSSYARYLGYTDPLNQSNAPLNEEAQTTSLETPAAQTPPTIGVLTGGSHTDKQVETSTTGSKWLISRWFDLLFVCGMAPWITAIVVFAIFGPQETTPLLSGQEAEFSHFSSQFAKVRQLSPFVPTAGPETDFASQKAFSIIFVVAALLIGEAHQFTSIIRYFSGFGNKKNRYRWLRVPMWGLYLSIVTVGLSLLGAPISDSFPLQITGAIAAIGFFAFPTVLMQHLAAQAKAVGMIYCGMNGYKLSKGERTLLSISTWLLALAGGATIAGPFELLENLDSQFPAMQVVPIGLEFAAQTAVALFAAKIIGRGIKTGEWLPVGPSLLWGNLALWVLLPVPELVFVWLSVPLLYHATQHWAVAWFTRTSELKANGVELTPRAAAFHFAKMVIPIQAFTLFILFLPAFFSTGFFRGNETLAVGWSMLVFYIHYFADRVVWRPQ